jgi:metal-responsive CopG/Arc/MetJ family transcriptional regulator
MKTAVSIPDPLFREAELAARRLKVSRSELYQRALQAFLARRRDEEVKASYDAAYSEEEADEDQVFRRAVARAALPTVEWKP